jgi:hypothetical protein
MNIEGLACLSKNNEEVLLMIKAKELLMHLIYFIGDIRFSDVHIPEEFLAMR